MFWIQGCSDVTTSAVWRLKRLMLRLLSHFIKQCSMSLKRCTEIKRQEIARSQKRRKKDLKDQMVIISRP